MSYPPNASYLLNFSFFFFNDTATTEIYTLSLHDALPIYNATLVVVGDFLPHELRSLVNQYFAGAPRDRKSTRLNSSHGYISYAVFCLKKKKKHEVIQQAAPNYLTRITSTATTAIKGR